MTAKVKKKVFFLRSSIFNKISVVIISQLRQQRNIALHSNVIFPQHILSKVLKKLKIHHPYHHHHLSSHPPDCRWLTRSIGDNPAQQSRKISTRSKISHILQGAQCHILFKGLGIFYIFYKELIFTHLTRSTMAHTLQGSRHILHILQGAKFHIFYKERSTMSHTSLYWIA